MPVAAFGIVAAVVAIRHIQSYRPHNVECRRKLSRGLSNKIIACRSRCPILTEFLRVHLVMYVFLCIRELQIIEIHEDYQSMYFSRCCRLAHVHFHIVPLLLPCIHCQYTVLPHILDAGSGNNPYIAIAIYVHSTALSVDISMRKLIANQCEHDRCPVRLCIGERLWVCRHCIHLQCSNPSH